VRNFVRPIVRCIPLAIFGLILNAALAAEDFPLTGNYTQNVACKGDGSDPATAKVTISPQEIVSNVGVCTILDKKKDGRSISAHVECKFAGGPLIGDVTHDLRVGHPAGGAHARPDIVRAVRTFTEIQMR